MPKYGGLAQTPLSGVCDLPKGHSRSNPFRSVSLRSYSPAVCRSTIAPTARGRPLTPEEQGQITDTAKKVGIGAAIGAAIQAIIETVPEWGPALAF